MTRAEYGPAPFRWWQVRQLRRAGRRAAGIVRAMPSVQLALRGLLAGTGALALLLAAGGRTVDPSLLVLLAVPALLAAVVRPAGAGPAVVLGAAATAWIVGYGVAAAPLGSTLVLAAVLYLHHLTAALLAAVPPTAAV